MNIEEVREKIGNITLNKEVPDVVREIFLLKENDIEKQQLVLQLVKKMYDRGYADADD